MLRDIKSNVVIPDYSLYIFIGLIIITLLILFFVGRYVYKKLKRNIIMLNLEDSKNFAYEITPYLKEIEEFDLINRLEEYKYKKSVKKIDDSLIQEIREAFKNKGIKIEF